MIKTCVMKTTLLVLLASATLSVNAKPSEIRKWENAAIADRQSEALTVAARGFAGRTLGPKKVDVPISCAKPKQA